MLYRNKTAASFLGKTKTERKTERKERKKERKKVTHKCFILIIFLNTYSIKFFLQVNFCLSRFSRSSSFLSDMLFFTFNFMLIQFIVICANFDDLYFVTFVPKKA